MSNIFAVAQRMTEAGTQTGQISTQGLAHNVAQALDLELHKEFGGPSTGVLNLAKVAANFQGKKGPRSGKISYPYNQAHGAEDLATYTNAEVEVHGGVSVAPEAECHLFVELKAGSMKSLESLVLFSTLAVEYSDPSRPDERDRRMFRQALAEVEKFHREFGPPKIQMRNNGNGGGEHGNLLRAHVTSNLGVGLWRKFANEPESQIDLVLDLSGARFESRQLPTGTITDITGRLEGEKEPRECDVKMWGSWELFLGPGRMVIETYPFPSFEDLYIHGSEAAINKTQRVDWRKYQNEIKRRLTISFREFEAQLQRPEGHGTRYRVMTKTKLPEQILQQAINSYVAYQIRNQPGRHNPHAGGDRA